MAEEVGWNFPVKEQILALHSREQGGSSTQVISHFSTFLPHFIVHPFSHFKEHCLLSHVIVFSPQFPEQLAEQFPASSHELSSSGFPGSLVQVAPSSHSCPQAVPSLSRQVILHVELASQSWSHTLTSGAHSISQSPRQVWRQLGAEQTILVFLQSKQICPQLPVEQTIRLHVRSTHP